jgi:hypothetical protein
MAAGSIATFGRMIAIQFPEPAFQIKQEQGKDFVFDALRKKWLVLTPEEWVRQNFIQYLVQVLNYPKSLLALEKEIALGELRKRFDIVVYNRDGQPWMLVECKAMGVPLATHVSEQILRYNQTVKAQYLVVTNGIYTRCFQLYPAVAEMENMPAWIGVSG